MSHEYHEEHINSWLDQADKSLSSERLASLFGETLENLSKRASLALNKTILMTIVKRVLVQSSEKFPVLARLKVESTGIPPEQFAELFRKVDSNELAEAFRFFMNQLLTVLGDLTADVLPVSLEEYTPTFDFVERRQSGERIEHLFEISKIFAGFESIEKSFPEIFMIMGKTLAFETILLIEKREDDCMTFVWCNENTVESDLKRSFDYSRKSYEYLVGPFSCHDVENYESVIKTILPRMDTNPKNFHNQFITLPLTLSSLQSFGVLQFDILKPLTEEDLRYVTAISNLLAITLDRYNKEKIAEKKRQVELSIAERELDLAHEYVVELEKERDLREQFVSILTHDLRTPLTAAKMASQLIMRRPENGEKNLVLASKVIGSINRMDQMINDLLDANRIRAGEALSFSMEPCDMRSIAFETLKEFSVAYGDRFIMECERLPIEGFWNAGGIRRVLENLVNNAVKYGSPQQVITISIKSVENSIQIIVHNQGNPISPEDQRYLFQPFHRTVNAINAEKKGWGLGLTLVRGVAEAHGGSVKVHSNEEDGTSFIVTIPRDSRPFQVAKQ